MLILLVCSALISGSEVAYFSLGPNEKESIENAKDKKSEILTSLLDKPKRLLATILIANNFVNVGIVILSTYLTNLLLSNSLSQTTQFIIQVVVVTFLLLLLGEVIPKIYANKKPLSLASFMALPIYYLRILLLPISKLLVSSTNFIDKRIKKKGHNISVDELSQALELTSDEDRLTNIIRNAFIFKNGNRRYKYLILGHEETYFVKEHSDSKHKYSEDDIINMLEFLVDTIFVVFAGKVFQQTVGIPMGTNCARFSPTSFCIRISYSLCSQRERNIKHLGSISLTGTSMMYCP